MAGNDVSNVQISNEVISTIAGVAAMEVEGVHALSSSRSTNNIKDIIYKKSPSKGVTVESDEFGAIKITVNIIVKYNYKIQDVAVAVQEQISRSVADMTSFEASQINVNVVGVNIPKTEEVK